MRGKHIEREFVAWIAVLLAIPQVGMGEVELLGVLELNFSNPEFRTRSYET